MAEAWVTHLDYGGRSRGWVESEVLPLCSLLCLEGDEIKSDTSSLLDYFSRCQSAYIAIRLLTLSLMQLMNSTN